MVASSNYKTSKLADSHELVYNEKEKQQLACIYGDDYFQLEYRHPGGHFFPQLAVNMISRFSLVIYTQLMCSNSVSNLPWIFTKCFFGKLVVLKARTTGVLHMLSTTWHFNVSAHFFHHHAALRIIR